MTTGPVEVWWARIEEARDEFADDLDAVELTRLEAYRRRPDKARFLVGCTLVRRLLGARFSLPPAKVSLDRTCPDCGRPHGRIRVDGAEVSVTHSGELIGVAIHPQTPVGLDVEQVDRKVDPDALATICLSPAEARELARYDDTARLRAFTTYWTRKEAVVKATGTGIRMDLREIVVSAPDRAAALLGGPGPMQLVDLEVESGYAAALAALSREPLIVRTRDATTLLR